MPENKRFFKKITLPSSCSITSTSLGTHVNCKVITLFLSYLTRGLCNAERLFYSIEVESKVNRGGGEDKACLSYVFAMKLSLEKG